MRQKGDCQVPPFYLEPLHRSQLPFASVTSENRGSRCQRTRLAVVKCLSGVPAFFIDFIQAYDRHLPKRRIQYVHT